MDCVVCNLSNSGLHYQVRCCRACAAFFRRTIQCKIRYKCCNGGKCEVTHEERFGCRFCRLKKCVDAGMVFQGTTNFDFHFDTVEVSEIETLEPQPSEFFSISNVFGDIRQFYIEFEKRIDFIMRKPFQAPSNSDNMNICSQVSKAWENLMAKWPECRKGKLKFSKKISFSQLMCDFFKGVEHTAEFCMEIKEFAELPYNQRSLIYLQFILRFPTIYRALITVECLGHDVNDSRVITRRGVPFDFETSELNFAESSNFPGEQLKESIIKTETQANILTMKPYKRLYADDFEKSFIISSIMWCFNGIEGISPETLKVIEEIRNHLAEELNYYYRHIKKLNNYAARIYKMYNLVIDLDKIAKLREQDSYICKTFQLLNTEVHLTELLINCKIEK